MNRHRSVGIAAAVVTLVVAGAAVAATSGVLHIAIASGGSSASGITVHGKWNLVVRARNGHVITRRKFENSLTSDGAFELAGLLTGGTLGAVNGGAYGNQWAGEDSVVGGQAVRLDDGNTIGSAKGCWVLVYLDSCVLYHSDGQNPYTPNSGDSDAASSLQGSGGLHLAATGSAIKLTGSVAMIQSTTITEVETLLKLCVRKTGFSSSVGPGDCASDDGSDGGTYPFEPHWLPFTAKTIAPLAVQAGQSIAVSVQLSFS